MKLAILKIEPINFALKNNAEKEIVTQTFQRFLNSLDFPVQIVIATDSLNLDVYLATLSERMNEQHRPLFDDFKQHLHSFITKEGLLNRSFYLVIPEKENIEIQVSVCQELLKNMNLSYKRLEGEDITFFVSSFFNDVYAENTSLKNSSDLLSSIAPQSFTSTPTEVKVNDTFARTIAVKGYPRSVEEGFLDKIITINGNFDIALHIEPYPIDTMMIMLNKELQKQRGDLWSLEQKGIINPTLEIQYSDTRKVLENLQKGNEKLFNISLYITCKGNTLEELNILTKKI